MKKVGITTNIPVEVVFAAGMQPVDLNNIFVIDDESSAMVENAEDEGFPRNMCSWIKGRYSSAFKSDLDCVVGVSEGDCSNTKALMEVLESKGIPVYEFSYPKSKNVEDIKKEIKKLQDIFKVDYAKVDTVKRELYRVRQKVKKLDELTYIDDKATGFENHLYQVSCSDFEGDYLKFEKSVEEKIEEIEQRKPANTKVRLGYMGVPPIFSDLYEVIEGYEGKIMFNEVQRQFSFSWFDIDEKIEDMYLKYTYPYTLKGRLNDIKAEIKNRKLDGIIHYTQAFCYRGIEDIIVKKELDIPVLTLEGDLPGKIDSRTKIRLEAFIDMLKDLKEIKN